MKYAKFDEELGAEDEPPRNESKAWDVLKEIGDTTLFMWMKPILELGNRQPLDFADLLELHPQDRADTVNLQFQQAWHAQLTTKENPSIVMAYAHAFGYPFYLAGGLKLIHDLLIFCGPYFLNRIIYFLDDPSQPLSMGLTFVALLFLSNLIMSLCLRQYFYRCFRVGMRLRSAVIASVFSKALMISSGVLSRRSVGEITNLMSVDSTRLQNLVSYLHAVWFTFLQMTLALYFLWQQVGVACLGGVTMIIIAIPVTQRISSYLKDIQKVCHPPLFLLLSRLALDLYFQELSAVRDERVKLSNEVLGSMKVVHSPAPPSSSFLRSSSFKPGNRSFKIESTRREKRS
jgi:ATP-binding cassette, subfamily C (CFTR/MRP), member 1